MRRPFLFLLVVAASAVVSATEKRFDAGADVEDVNERRILKFAAGGGAHKGRKKAGGTIAPRTVIPRTHKKRHIRHAPMALMRMRADQSPPPSCESYEVASGSDDCVIDPCRPGSKSCFWQDYDMTLTDIAYDSAQDSVRFDVVQISQEMCQYREDIECLWVTAFPSSMTAGTTCGMLEDVDCGEKGKFTVDVGCDGQGSVYVDVFSREGLKLRNNFPMGILPPAACASQAEMNPGMFHRNYMCHKRFEVSCVAC